MTLVDGLEDEIMTFCPYCDAEVRAVIDLKFVRATMPDGSKESSLLAQATPFSHKCPDPLATRSPAAQG